LRPLNFARGAPGRGVGVFEGLQDWKATDAYREAVAKRKSLQFRKSHNLNIWEEVIDRDIPLRGVKEIAKLRGFNLYYSSSTTSYSASCGGQGGSTYDGRLQHPGSSFSMQFRERTRLHWLSPFQIQLQTPLGQPKPGMPQQYRTESYDISAYREPDYYHYFHLYNRQQLRFFTSSPFHISYQSRRGLVLIRKYYGLLDKHGRKLTPAEFQHIQYERGLYQVSKNGRIGYLDTRGQWVYPSEGL
ncbi:MAG: hypothetical protein AAF206_21410, partial [Bacteroidota bacterium]